MKQVAALAICGMLLLSASCGERPEPAEEDGLSPTTVQQQEETPEEEAPPSMEPLPPRQPLRYSYGLLREEEQSLYESMALAAEGQEEQVLLPVGGMGERGVQRTVEAFRDDNPDCFLLEAEQVEEEGQRLLVLRPYGSLTLEQAAARREALERAAEEILGAAAGLSELETALLIHDRLASAVAYDREMSGMDSGNAFGALVEGRAYCDGFARAFQHLAQQAGLDAIYIGGTSQPRDVPHAWNAVRIDGVWQYVDVTWDRPQGEYDGVYHDWFLISREEMALQHTPDPDRYPSLPDSGPDHRCYYEQVGYVGYGYPTDDPGELFSAEFLRQLRSMDPEDFSEQPEPVFLEMKVVCQPEYWETWKEYFIQDIFYILNNIEQQARGEGQPFGIELDTSVRCDFNDTMQVITFYPKVQRRGGQE